MIRKSLCAAAAVFAIGSLGAAPVAAVQSTTYYEYIYFADATYSEEVGFRWDTCVNGQVFPGQVVGEETPYFRRTAAGLCGGGGQPY